MSNPSATPTAFKRLLRFAHPGLLVAAAILLAVQGFLTSKYYHDALGTQVFSADIRTWVAAAASIGFKLLAFGLLFISVLDFSEGRKRVGKWGFLATGVLNLYFVYESHSMASMWAETPEAYWHIFPMLLSETLMVLFVEWRLAFSVGQAQESENHLAVAAQREQALSERLAAALSELSALQAEKTESENAQRAEQQRIAEQAATLAARQAEQQEQEREQREAQMQSEIQRLQRRLAVAEKSDTGKTKKPGTRQTLLETAVRLTQQNGTFPTIRAIEDAAGFSDGTAKYHFPNGSLQAQALQILQAPSEVFSKN